MAMNAHSNVGCFKKDTSQRDLCKMTLLPNVVYVTFNTATGTVSSKKKKTYEKFFCTALTYLSAFDFIYSSVEHDRKVYVQTLLW